MFNCDPAQKIESSYCCAATNGTLTQDGLNGICDCDSNRDSTGPLHFGENASAITTINVVSSSPQNSLPKTHGIASSSSSSQNSLPNTHMVASSPQNSLPKTRVVASSSSSSQNSLPNTHVVASSSPGSLPTTTALKTTSPSVQSQHFEGKSSTITSTYVVASSSPTITALTKTSSYVQGFSSVSVVPALTTGARSITSFSTSTIPPSPSASPSLSPSPQLSNKRAVAVGAGVGTPLVLIILGLAAFLLYRKISHSSHETSLSSDSLSSDFDPSVPPSPQHQSVGEHEVSESTEEHEMQAEPGRYEGREFLYRRRASDSVSTLSEEGGITNYVHTDNGCSKKLAPQTTESL